MAVRRRRHTRRIHKSVVVAEPPKPDHHFKIHLLPIAKLFHKGQYSIANLQYHLLTDGVNGEIDDVNSQLMSILENEYHVKDPAAALQSIQTGKEPYQRQVRPPQQIPTPGSVSRTGTDMSQSEDNISQRVSTSYYGPMPLDEFERHHQGNIGPFRRL